MYFKEDLGGKEKSLKIKDVCQSQYPNHPSEIANKELIIIKWTALIGNVDSC